MQWLLAAFLFVAAPLLAQDAAVSIKLDLVAWGDEIGGLSLKSGESGKLLTARSFCYSEPVAYKGPALMEIYQHGGGTSRPAAEPTEDDKAHQISPLEGTPARQGEAAAQPARTGLALELEKRRKDKPDLVALAALPAGGCRRATVLLAPADDGTFSAHVIDDDPSKLPPGQMRIHNLSPYPVMIRCNGNDSKELKNRETHLVRARDEQVVYELAYKAKDEWKMQENNIIPLPGNEQVQMMILKSDNSFFLSSDGASGGFLQIVFLRRTPTAE
ncbi:DUF4397 domain-containing protein [Luteolibacter marinus]|uniref:DUF4397 domain-containing protein n=1 Tax=Luteolibacter marinus TaxID=2776705 RepID=UPI0018678387|nr:DUF4397 domain-containing protein [Luteolibacter marinus]